MIEIATLCEIDETGTPDPELTDWIRGGWTASVMRLFGLDNDGPLDAFGLVECRQGRAALQVEVRVRPGRDRDLGLPLLAAARESAGEFDAAKPVHVFANASAVTQRQWLEAQGAVEVRHFWRMAIDLNEDSPQVPGVPDGCVVRVVRAEDAEWRTVFRVVDDAFVAHFGHTGERTYDQWVAMWRSHAGFDPTLWWMAELDGRPVAALLALTMQGDDAETIGHVGTLGTLSEARGRGIGATLLRTAFAEFRRRGISKVTLDVDSENSTGAVALYERVGMHQTADWAVYELPPVKPHDSEPIRAPSRRGNKRGDRTPRRSDSDRGSA